MSLVASTNVPRIIEYSLVLEKMQAQGLVCNYFNSGAFGFPRGVEAQTIAWVGPPDDSIRAAARPLTRNVSEPYEPNLASLATRAWQQHLPGPLWVMPMSHWAYELDFGSQQWMPELLEAVGIPPGDLKTRTSAAAIEFAPDEQAQFRLFVQGLLKNLSGSDFLLGFPQRPAVCMVHHHKQLWWTSSDGRLIGEMEKMVSGNGQG